MILSAADGAGPTARTRTVVLVTAAIIVMAAVLLGVAALAWRYPATGGSGGAPGAALGAAAPSGGEGTSDGPSSPKATPTGPPATPQSPVDDAGGLSAARARVDAFVAALNAADFERANSLMCSAKPSWYGPGSLGGIVPHSFDVGGVHTDGRRGSAIIVYRLDSSSAPGQTPYDLIVEDGAWRICARS